MKDKKVPLRMCVACREMKDKGDLYRIVRTGEGNAEIDSSGKKSGRGAYICRDRQCVMNSQKTRKLERNLKQTSCTVVYEQLLRLTEIEHEQ